MKLFRKNSRNIVIEARVIEAGDDLCIVVTGGQKQHIGSVSISIPRSSLENPEKLSATTSTYNFVSHKDDIIGNQFSKKIATALNKKTVVTCGIHLDDITEEQMSTVHMVSEKLLQDIIEELKSSE